MPPIPRGLYATDEGEMQRTVRLFRNGEAVKDMEIPAMIDLGRLVRYIVRELKRIISAGR